jgi:hypothetical protein
MIKKKNGKNYINNNQKVTNKNNLISLNNRNKLIFIIVMVIIISFIVYIVYKQYRKKKNISSVSADASDIVSADALTTTSDITSASTSDDTSAVIRQLPPQISPPYFGTIFIEPNIVTDTDVSTYISSPYAGQKFRRMFDRRNNWVFLKVYLFNATFNDGLSCEIQVNPEFGSLDKAFIEAEKYGKEIGKLPTCLRTDVDTVWIHSGMKPFGGGNRNLLIHTGQAQEYINSGILVETLIHEACHTSLDLYYADDSNWEKAQSLDNGFISTYAKDNPHREDIAESFLCYFAVTYRSDKISPKMYETITETIPNRINYFKTLNLNMYPYVK